ncbi:MAG: hypothetical protein HC811_13680 [Flammeovirgaceae bacterium]|nr:hypothetical protein [Flammeovirgaceae bacterium]
MAGSDFADLLSKNLHRDKLLQRTTAGIHKDDFIFLLDDVELKRFGSQGQQKSFLIALKLAEFQMIQEHKGFRPILLLDDIFDKLDDFRIQHLLGMINKKSFGQIFITDARPDRSKQLLQESGTDVALFKVDKGTLKAISV